MTSLLGRLKLESKVVLNKFSLGASANMAWLFPNGRCVNRLLDVAPVAPFTSTGREPPSRIVDGPKTAQPKY
ncbi:hypothetical protein FRB94_007889 [Tulasnella sp. JGI-2019a]|nr:hypothetical protein FRB94_007889 [Tulasnella sp. JGI-2019a]